MNHIKLFEQFKDGADDKNISIKKAVKKVDEASQAEEKKAEDRLEKLFKKLVPSNGAADTIEGEMVRSIMRIWYRYFNDGDYFYKGYGKETAQPSVSWLLKCPIKSELSPIFRMAREKRSPESDEYTPKDMYLDCVIKAANAVCDYVEGQNGKYTKNDGHDSR